MALFGKKKDEAQPSKGNPKDNIKVKDKKVYVAARETIDKGNAWNMMAMALAYGDLVDADNEGGLDYEWFSPKPGTLQGMSLMEITMKKVAAEFNFEENPRNMLQLVENYMIKSYYHPEKKPRIAIEDMEFLVTQFIKK